MVVPLTASRLDLPEVPAYLFVQPLLTSLDSNAAKKVALV